MFVKRLFVFLVFFSVFVMYPGNACRLAIEDRKEPKHLSEYHANFSRLGYYYTMPEKPEELEEIIQFESWYTESDKLEHLCYVWHAIDINITDELGSRFRDGDVYFVDKYLKRFDNFCLAVSLEKYSEAVIPLFDVKQICSIVFTLFSDICMLHGECENSPEKLDLLFRITYGLHVSLMKCPLYLDEWVANSASLLDAYKNLDSDFKNSDTFKIISAEVQQILLGGIASTDLE